LFLYGHSERSEESLIPILVIQHDYKKRITPFLYRLEELITVLMENLQSFVALTPSVTKLAVIRERSSRNLAKTSFSCIICFYG
jgi:hypothetical protein